MRATLYNSELPAHQGVSAWIRLIKVYNLVLRKARAGMTECTLAQFDVLAHLLREKEGIPHTELSRHLLVTAGNITGLIDRMETSGLVRRKNDSNDRRIIRVELTPKGRKLAERVIPKHSADVESLFETLSEKEKLQLRAILDKLIHNLERKS